MGVKMRKEDGTYEYTLGQTVGLEDSLDGSIDWYKLLAIEIDDELPIAWFYLSSESESLNNKTHPEFGNFAEIIESVSERLVVQD